MMEKPRRLNQDMVGEMVSVAHGDLDRVKALLEAESALVNATWDWGGGDWETALGAASHMGRKDIAEYLLAEGARMDLFCAAMLGKIGVVKAALEDTPDIVHVKGPHGISLLQHAEAGKQGAMIELLQSYGAT